MLFARSHWLFTISRWCKTRFCMFDGPWLQYFLLFCAVCSTGTFGQDCVENCTCVHGECHHVTGTCMCELGWMGELCNETCPPGMFGPGCTHSCACQNGASCNSMTGCCLCEEGFYGQMCELGRLLIYFTCHIMVCMIQNCAFRYLKFYEINNIRKL